MGTAISSPETKNKTSEDGGQKKKNTQENSENIPSVYVNRRLLQFNSNCEKGKSFTKDRKVYRIDGKMYTENLGDMAEDFKAFKLYAERINIKEKEIEVPAPKKLEMAVQIFELGYLINSTVYLNQDNYNTLIMVIDDYSNCFVCDQVVYKDDVDGHIRSDNHERNIGMFPPLEEFCMSIVRLRKEHYHCGVCNIVFHKNNSEQHLNGKSHADNLTLATKNVTNIKNKNNNTNIKNKNNDMKPNKNNDRVIIISDVKNKDEEIENRNKYIVDCTVSVKVGKVVLEIPYYTWNMISISKSKKNNTFYCMACKINESIVNMANHIYEISHDNNCKKFKINHAYEEHLIRQDDKFSHCGTCNTIHYLDGIDMHINMVHKKTKATKQSTQNVPKSDNKINDNQIENNKAPSPSIIKIENDNSITNRNNDLINAIMNERCFVILFGIKINVLFLSLNVIYRNEYGFYCGLCRINFLGQYIHDHVKGPIHLMNLNSTPALQQYGYNYIRSIHNLPHCGICHVIVQPAMLFYHLQHPSHTMLANIALGLKPTHPQQSLAVARIAPTLKTEAANSNNDDPNANNDPPNVNNDVQNLSQATTDEIQNINNTNNENENDFNETDDFNDIDTDNNENFEFVDDKNAAITEVEVALKKVNSQITLMSYNAMVPVGDGTRYCFVCDQIVVFELLKKHISNDAHTRKLKVLKFVQEYAHNLIRQKSVLYHCALCNVILKRSELKKHVNWPIHEEQKKIMTNLKKSDIKKLPKNIYVTQKEAIYFREKEPQLKIILSLSITENQRKYTEKNKIIELRGYNFKLTLKWDAWHSIASIKNIFKCIICQEPLNEAYEHIDSEKHKLQLATPFMKEYFPTLLRKVSDNIFNCVVCNTELYDTENILIHLKGKKHKNKFDTLLNNSSDDSSEDILSI